MTTILNGGQPVTNEADLNTAIRAAAAAAANSGAYEIDIGQNITLMTALEAINLKTGVMLDIEGGNYALDGNNNTERGLFVYAGTVTIDSLTIRNAAAIGGSGGGNGSGGGGGAGLGGGLFIGSNVAGDVGKVTLNNVSFTHDSATGGGGGGGGTADGGVVSGGYGGGGGLGGNGGSSSDYYGGGGGGVGAGAFGGNFINGGDGNGGAGIIPASVGGGRAPPYSIGGASGGGGGVWDGGGGGGGVGGGVGASGGGGGSDAGGFGGYGGGGGGGGGSTGLNYGGASGDGGFGGGGGGNRGHGGFGGGGGGGAGEGGFGGGEGGSRGGGGGSVDGGGGGGGGGLGAGGDIFVQQGGSLIIQGGSLGAATVTAGAAGRDGSGIFNVIASRGAAYGAGLFLQGQQTQILEAASGQTLRITGVIADENGSVAGSTTGTGGGLVIGGAGYTGTVALDAANTFTGGVEVNEGTLSIGSAGNIGTGTLTLDNGTSVDLTAGFTLTQAITVSGDPAFTVGPVQSDTIAGAIADGASPGTVEVTGGGTLDLDNASNSYSGGTTIEDDSTFEIGVADAAGSGAITFSGTGDTLKIDGTTMPSNRIGGMVAGNTIDLANIAYTSGASATLFPGGDLQVRENSHTYDVKLAGSFTGDFFHLSAAVGGGTDITEDQTACYCRGTLILTEKGEVAVEELTVGDRLVTLGEAKPIHWIGRRSYNGRFVAGNKSMLPICVRRDAIMKGVPGRDLWVSPEHSLYIDDVLVQAKHLVNGATVVQAESIEEVEYFHIELESHDIIYADGAPAESFVDCDNRLMFTNGAAYAALYPDDARPRWQFCAPRLEWGSAELQAIRAWMFERARAIFPALGDGPDLHLVIDGVVVAPVLVTGAIHRFDIPGGSTVVHLASQSSAPAEQEAASRDRRRLGVALEHIVLSDADLSIEAWHHHPSLCDGFHADESSHRWTDGLARLPEHWLRPFPGGAMLEVHLIPTDMRYRIPPPSPSRGIAAA